VADSETENELVAIELVNFIDVSSSETEVDTIVDIEIFDQGIFITDSEAENEAVNIKVPSLGNISVEDSEVENEFVSIVEGNYVLDVSDAETEAESVTIIESVSTLAISVSDSQNVGEFITIRDFEFFTADEVETEGELVTLFITKLYVSVDDAQTENEFVKVGIPEPRNVGPYIVYTQYNDIYITSNPVEISPPNYIIYNSYPAGSSIVPNLYSLTDSAIVYGTNKSVTVSLQQ
jgi:hypothetical protein